MTPEEKTKELFNKFIPHSRDNSGFGYNREMEVRNAKASAIICVDEIISSLKQYGTLVESATPQWIEPDTEYWEQVKAEIEKL